MTSVLFQFSLKVLKCMMAAFSRFGCKSIHKHVIFSLRCFPLIRQGLTAAVRAQYFSTAAEEKQTSEEDEHSVTISESCVKQLQKIKEKNQFLRVMVDGGGCSGFQYNFCLDDVAQSDDRIFERDGVKVVVDKDSLKLISGSVVDYKVELIRSAFQIKDNPNAEKGCSCGASFSVKI